MKAQTDPAAQVKIDRVVKHPELELYNIKEDPWELDNLADNPEYSPKLAEMHAQLKADMEKLNDVFSAVDPKDLLRAEKAQTEEPEPSGLTDKQKRREVKKLARKMGKEGET